MSARMRRRHGRHRQNPPDEGYRPVSGRLLVRLPGGPGQWNSPIVTDGRIALPEGDANQHRISGVLDIYRLP